MNNKKEEQILILNALLHDIGKYIWRMGENIKDKRLKELDTYWSHPIISYEFFETYLKDYFKELEDSDLKEFYDIPMIFHHNPSGIEKERVFIGEKEITNKEVIQKIKEIAKKVEKADKISAKERDEEEAKGNIQNKRIINPFNLIPKEDGESYFENTVLPRAKKIKAEEKEEGIQKKPIIKAFIQELKRIEQGKDIKERIEILTQILEQYTTFIPSASYKSKPTISLYDHLKTTAAIVLSLERSKNKKVSIIFGDLSGIQKFIFYKFKKYDRPARLIRGRSALLQIITEIIIDYIKEKFDLYEFNIIQRKGGNFAILCQNLEEGEIISIEKEINKELIELFGGILKISLTLNKDINTTEIMENFGDLMEKIREKNNIRKSQMFKEYIEEINEVIEDINKKDINEQDLCPVCGLRKKEEGSEVCHICKEIEEIGNKITKDSEEERIIYISKNSKGKGINLLNRSILLTKEEDLKIVFLDSNTKYENLINKKDLGFFIPLFINTYRPRTLNKEKDDFEIIAEKNDKKRLAIIKTDIDNLGDLFRNKKDKEEYKKIRISTYSFVSRLINLFYALNIPHLLYNKYKEEAYMVISGGDDLTLVVNAEKTLEIINEINKEFNEFFNKNKEEKNITFSSGVHVFYYKKPIHRAIMIAEENLSRAKKEENKKSICFDKESELVIKNEEIEGLINFKKELKDLTNKNKITENTIFRLNELWYKVKTNKNKRLILINPDPYLYYILVRNLRVHDKTEKDRIIENIKNHFREFNNGKVILKNTFPIIYMFYKIKEQKEVDINV